MTAFLPYLQRMHNSKDFLLTAMTYLLSISQRLPFKCQRPAILAPTPTPSITNYLKALAQINTATPALEWCREHKSMPDTFKSFMTLFSPQKSDKLFWQLTQRVHQCSRANHELPAGVGRSKKRLHLQPALWHHKRMVLDCCRVCIPS